MKNIPEKQSDSVERENILDQKIERITLERLIFDLLDKQIEEDAREEIFKAFLEERNVDVLLPELYKMAADKPFVVRMIIKNTQDMNKKMFYFENTYEVIEKTKGPEEKRKLHNELFNIKHGNTD